MKISKLKITNFRAIKSLEIDCSNSINVFVGVNGAGKSTVITAIKYLFSWFTARLKNAKGRGLLLLDSDITQGEQFCLLEIELSNKTTWKLFKQCSSNRDKPENKTELEQLSLLSNSLIKDFTADESNCHLPLIASYGVNRAVIDVPLRLNKKHELDPLQAYNLLDNKINFRSFFEWYREREDIDNENYRKAQPSLFSNDSTYPSNDINIYVEDNQIKAVREALHLTLPNYGHFRVQRSPRAFIMEKNGVKFRFEQLSDGEKCYITLVSDIARRLAMVNPFSLSPLDGSGIILIDEIDLHLHPTWQSEIITKLRSTFKNCQFFITTHSPHVISNVNTLNHEEVFFMHDGEATERSSRPYGKKIDEILLDFFDLPHLRNQDVESHLHTIWNLLDNNQYETLEYTEELDWLKNHLDPADIEFVKIKLEQAKRSK